MRARTPGPDRGLGGKYLLIPPGYAGPMPDGGYFIGWLLGRAFLVNNDPKPAVETIKKTLKIYPYVPGSYGTSMGTFLTGKGPLAPLSKPGELTFIEGTGLAMNTIPPNDFSYYEMLDALVQEQPAKALNKEIGGQFAAIGIVKGKKFDPDARMRMILTDAIAIANAAARTLSFRPREIRRVRLLQPNLEMAQSAIRRRLRLHQAAARDHQGGREAIPLYRRPNARRTRRLLLCRDRRHACDGDVSARGGLAISLRNLGLSGAPFDGAKTYKVTLPPKIPAAKFWSFTLYDNQTRSMLQTKQRFPRAGSQSFSSPAATPNPDGSTTVYFGPSKPDGVADGNWIETVPGKGWFTILRLYSPLESFFTKAWRPSEIENIAGKYRPRQIREVDDDDAQPEIVACRISGNWPCWWHRNRGAGGGRRSPALLE